MEDEKDDGGCKEAEEGVNGEMIREDGSLSLDADGAMTADIGRTNEEVNVAANGMIGFMLDAIVGLIVAILLTAVAADGNEGWTEELTRARARD